MNHPSSYPAPPLPSILVVDNEADTLTLPHAHPVKQHMPIILQYRSIAATAGRPAWMADCTILSSESPATLTCWSARSACYWPSLAETHGMCGLGSKGVAAFFCALRGIGTEGSWQMLEFLC